MSFSSPAGEEESLVVDFGAIHDLYASSPHRDEIIRLAPGSVFRAIGLGAICQSWGGFLAGVPLGRWYPELDDCFLVAVTEKRTQREIDALAESLSPAAR